MFQVNGREIGAGQKPFIIAELSANHAGSIQRAKDTMLAAKRAGADAVKIQSYTPDTMTIDSSEEDFMIKEGIWKGNNLYKLYEEAFTPFEWHRELFQFARKIGISIFSTPFDETAVDLLVDLDAPAYKIASFELIDLPLIKYVAKLSKPMFISTGMSNLDEIANAVETCFQSGNKDLLLFHCISNYPAELEDSNLGDIKYLANHFNLEVGLSDHTKSNMASILSVALGASILEKHFTDNHQRKGPDISCSMDINDCKELIKGSEVLFRERGGKKNIIKEEKVTSNFAFATVVTINNIKKGQRLNLNNIWVKRPGSGQIKASEFHKILGKRVNKDIKIDTHLKFKDII